MTICGDAIAPRGGVVTLGSLIRIAGAFRLTERLVRTSVARLAKDGWLVARKEGRQSEYRLTPGGEQRFAEATRRIYGKGPARWEGEWTLVVLPAAPGSPRERLREELRWLGFGQLSPGTFAHPNCTVEQARQWVAATAGAEGALCLRSTSDAMAIDRQIAARGWDLGELTRRYRRFLATFEPVEAAVRSSMRVEPVEGAVRLSAPFEPVEAAVRSPARFEPVEAAVRSLAPFEPVEAAVRSPARFEPVEAAVRSLAPFEPVEAAVRSSTPLEPEGAMIIRTLLIHEYRKIHLRDPLLPATLLPTDWVGTAAYELTRRLYSLVFTAAEKFLTATARTLEAPLPPAGAAAYERFGGMLASEARFPGVPRRSAGRGSRGARPRLGDRSSR